MQTYPLIAHSDHTPLAISAVEGRVLGTDANWLRLRWRVEGTSRLVIPGFAGKGRADELWKSTCFELFLRPDAGTGYCEFNLSPSERWAAYDFTSYREGISERPAPREPTCTMRKGSSFAIFDAALPLGALPESDCAMNLCAVLEEQGGVKSYWALSHGDGKADFHEPACFVATLPAPRPA